MTTALVFTFFLVNLCGEVNFCGGFLYFCSKVISAAVPNFCGGIQFLRQSPNPSSDEP
jgi:hypothetical protein